MIIILVTLVTNFVTLVTIYVTTYDTSYTFFIQDMIDKDMTSYNKLYMLRLITESVTMKQNIYFSISNI